LTWAGGCGIGRLRVRAPCAIGPETIAKEKDTAAMPKEEWGTKRVCPTTGKRFYDLNRTPIVSPYTGDVVTLDTGKSRSIVSEKAKPEKEADDEPVVLEDDDDNVDVDTDDDLLEDDDDEDSVSLDDLADVPADDEDT
jgi:uncharacterized protein (TIGR02300 family)